MRSCCVRSEFFVELIRFDWCPWRGSNARPLPYQGSALPLSHMGIDTGLGTHSLLSSSTQARSDRLVFFAFLERETGIEPASSAWKAGVLPLNYSRPGEPLATCQPEFVWWRRLDSNQRRRKPTDLQSAPFSHSGTPPRGARDISTAPGQHPQPGPTAPTSRPSRRSA